MGILDLGTLNRIANTEEYNREINDFSKAFEHGNLFNPNAAIEGKYLNNSGVLSENSSYYLTYIPVDINIDGKVSVKYCGNDYSVGAQCDINKNVITGTIFTGNYTTVGAQTLHPDCKYLAISTNGLPTDQIVNYGSTLNLNAGAYNNEARLKVSTEKEPTDIYQYDKNLMDNTKWKRDVALGSTGADNVEQGAGNATSPYILVNPEISDKINFKLRNGIGYVNIGRVCFYDIDRKFISLINAVDKNIGYFTLPLNCRYIRFSLSGYNTTYGFDAVLKYSIFPIEAMDLKEYSGGDGYNLITPDDIIPYYGISYDGTVNIAANNPGVTTYIPVKPNTDYFISPALGLAGVSSIGTSAHYYSQNKKYLGALKDGDFYGWNNIIHTPVAAYYIVFSLPTRCNNIDRDQFLGLVEAEKWNGIVGKTVSDDGRVRAAYTNGFFPCGMNGILGVYENFIAVVDFTGTKLRISGNGWAAKMYRALGATGSPFVSGWAEYPIDDTTFPGFTSGMRLEQVVFFRANSSEPRVIGCLVFGTNGKIWYCSNVNDVKNITFAVPDIWDLKGNKSWRIDETVDANKKVMGTVTRYKKYYPSDIATRQNPFYWHNGPLWFDGIGGQWSRGLAFCNYTDAQGSSTPSPSCLYYTENGKDIYVMYEFGVHPKSYKRGGNETLYTLSNFSKGDTVDTSDTSLFPAGSSFTTLTIKKRTTIIPSDAVKDPTALFEYGDAVTVSSASGTTFTVSDASGLAVGDVVIFEGTAAGGYAKLLTTSIDSTTKVGNGNIFVITAISGNDLTIADAVGNPKNNLFCRHIHGLCLFGQGLCIYTGEEYPESWMIYMNPCMDSVYDETNMNNNRWETDTVRLNASENAYQRSLGVYLRSDGKMVYIADTNQPQSAKLTVRDKNIKMGNYGVMVFPLSDIDNAASAITKIPGVNAGYALYYVGGVLLFSDYYGKTYYSDDEGDTWKYLCRGLGDKCKLLGFDRFAKRFYFNTDNIGGRYEQFIFEVL